MESIPEKLAISVVVVQLLSHVWLCNPMDCSTPGFSVSHNLWKFVQVHVHWISDAIQPSHPLSPSCPPAPNLSQHQGLSQRVGSLHQGPKHWSFSFSVSPSNECSGLISLGLTGLISLQSNGLSRVFSSTTVQKHQFFSAQPSYGLVLISIMTTEKTITLTRWTFVSKGMSLLFFFFNVYLPFYFFIFFLFVVDFVIHWNETAMGLHVFPIPIPPPTSLSTRSL